MLHEWEMYQYNNKAYTQLFKESSADQSLPSYCTMMQRSEANKHVAIALLVLLLLIIGPPTTSCTTATGSVFC